MSDRNLVNQVEKLNDKIVSIKSYDKDSDTISFSHKMVLEKFDSIEGQFVELSDANNILLKKVKEYCLCKIAARHNSINADHQIKFNMVHQLHLLIMTSVLKH